MPVCAAAPGDGLKDDSRYAPIRAELGLSARTRKGYCSNAGWLSAVGRSHYTAFNRSLC